MASFQCLYWSGLVEKSIILPRISGFLFVPAAYNVLMAKRYLE